MKHSKLASAVTHTVIGWALTMAVWHGSVPSWDSGLDKPVGERMVLLLSVLEVP